MWQRWQQWQERRILQRHPLPERLWQPTLGHPLLTRLSRAEQSQLGRLTTLFCHHKRFYAADGWTLDPATRVHIAALACLPILNLGLDYYRAWHSLVVYPDGFWAPREYQDEAGVVHEGFDALSGEAWEVGPVLLSWEDICQDDAHGGGHVVIHEMAHKLDMLDGEVNGCPPLHADMDRRTWRDSFLAAYESLATAIDRGQPTLLDDYALEDPGEFFASASEVFFTVPQACQHDYPAVYQQLRDFYRQDPLERSLA